MLGSNPKPHLGSVGFSADHNFPSSLRAIHFITSPNEIENFIYVC